MPKHKSWIDICPLDILQELSVFSKSVQKQVSLLVGHYGARDDLLGNIQQLQTNAGRSVLQLLRDSSCDDEDCTLDTFYTADSLIWNDVSLEKGAGGRTGNRVPSLDEFRDQFVPAVIREFTKYFPEGEFDDYKVFDPKLWPEELAEARNYGKKEIRRLAITLMPELTGIQLDDVVHEWSALLPEMKEKFENFCIMKRLDILDFWERAMSPKNQNPVVAWELYPTIYKLLAKVLCIPVGQWDSCC